MGLFRQTFAVDTNGLPLAGMKGRIYDIDDTTGIFPLEMTDAAGVPITFVIVSDVGVNQSFNVPDRSQVLWISEDGEHQAIFESLSSMLESSIAAAATAQTAVQQTAQFLALRGVPGGIAGLNTEGDVMDADEDVVGNDTRRPGSVVFATGAATPRPTASTQVMVLWITDGTQPVNALAGVDVWLNEIGGQLS